MSEITTEYRSLQERRRHIQNKMDVRFFGTMAFSAIALLETGGLIYNELENSGKINEFTGITAAGIVFGTASAINAAKSYKRFKEELAEADSDFKSFKARVLSPEYDQAENT